ncbi:MAG: hypothetical protein AVDCRST_MAG19-3047, partial [uncultured Thermomicrobiales bacterium]
GGPAGRSDDGKGGGTGGGEDGDRRRAGRHATWDGHGDRTGAGTAGGGRALGLGLRRHQGGVRRGNAPGVRLRPLPADDAARLRGALPAAARRGAGGAPRRPRAVRRRRAQRLHPLPARLRARAGADLRLLLLAADRNGAPLHRPDPGRHRRADAVSGMARAGVGDRRGARLPARQAGGRRDAARRRAQPRGGPRLRRLRDRQPAVGDGLPAGDANRLRPAPGQHAAARDRGAGGARRGLGRRHGGGLARHRLHGRPPELCRVHALELGHRAPGRGRGDKLWTARAGGERGPLRRGVGRRFRPDEDPRRGARARRAGDCAVAAAGAAGRRGGNGM